MAVNAKNSGSTPNPAAFTGERKEQGTNLHQNQQCGTFERSRSNTGSTVIANEIEKTYSDLTQLWIVAPE